MVGACDFGCVSWTSVSPAWKKGQAHPSDAGSFPSMRQEDQLYGLWQESKASILEAAHLRGQVTRGPPRLHPSRTGKTKA